MKARKKRPRSVTFIFLGVVFLGLWNAAQLFALIQQVSLLLSLNIDPDPRLRLALAAGWMLLFWIVAIALWLKKAYTRWMIPLLIALYALYELVLVELYVRVPVSLGSTLLRIVLSAAAVLFAVWALNRDPARNFFQMEERLAPSA